MRLALIAMFLILSLLVACNKDGSFDWQGVICDHPDGWAAFLCKFTNTNPQSEGRSAAYVRASDAASNAAVHQCDIDHHYFFGGACFTEAEFQDYFDTHRDRFDGRSGTSPDSASRATANIDPECISDTECKSYCGDGVTVVGRVCVKGTCTDGVQTDCSKKQENAKCISIASGAFCSVKKQCKTAQDCGNGRPSVCLVEGGATLVTYYCTSNSTCSSITEDCRTDRSYGPKAVCRYGMCHGQEQAGYTYNQ